MPLYYAVCVPALSECLLICSFPLLPSISLKHFYYIYLFVCVRAWLQRSEDNLWEFSPFYYVGPWGLNSGHLTWWQAPLLIEPFCLPSLCFSRSLCHCTSCPWHTVAAITLLRLLPPPVPSVLSHPCSSEHPWGQLYLFMLLLLGSSNPLGT